MNKRSHPRERTALRAAKKMRLSSGSVAVAYGEVSETTTSPARNSTLDIQADIQVEEKRIQKAVKPVDKQIEQAIQKHNGHGAMERDLWNTIRHLAYQQSIDISRSLVQWGCKGGIRDRRVSFHSNRQEKKFDPTANSFTLWPLPSEICPAPDWTLQDELAALVTTSKRKINAKNHFDDSLEDLDSLDCLTETLVDQNQKTLLDLFNNLYEFHPPHSSSIPIYTKRRSPHKSKDKTDNPVQPAGATNDQEADFGLDWKFVLKVAESTLNLKQSVLQRVQQRLCEIYRIPLEKSALDQEYHRQRKLNSTDPLVSSPEISNGSKE